LRRKENIFKKGKASLIEILETSLTLKERMQKISFVFRANGTNCSCLVLTLGAKVNALDEDGYSPLHLAVRLWDLTIIRLLLNHGEAMGQTDFEGGGRSIISPSQYFGVCSPSTRRTTLFLTPLRKIFFVDSVARLSGSGFENTKFEVPWTHRHFTRDRFNGTPLAAAIYFQRSKVLTLFHS
jgi:ankyrin repeat protein